ncbi:MAG: hypothetical protein BWK79_00270 [Beggiatoa sp. IS2]|nr:MAG: hypothetical protein BWK79_00270 [Beggiatoa sp. IS2]
MNDRTTVVMATLRKLADKQGICCASYQEIVKHSGYGRSTVIQAVSELTIAGRIVKNSNTELRKNRYEICE